MNNIFNTMLIKKYIKFYGAAIVASTIEEISAHKAEIDKEIDLLVSLDLVERSEAMDMVLEYALFRKTGKVNLEGLSVITADGINFAVMRNPVITAENGIGFCGVIPIRGGGLLVTDNSFENISDRAKNFLVHHEAGHIINNDIFSENVGEERTTSIMNGEVQQYELNADIHAAYAIGWDESIDALREMKGIMENTPYGELSAKEIGLRINALKQAAVVAA